MKGLTAALHDMAALPVVKSGTGKPWKHHVVVGGRSACMGWPVIESSIKPASEVLRWNRCRIRACAMRWPEQADELTSRMIDG